jgi:hypothetical protein
VNVSAFYMAQNLVTKTQWDTVRTWCPATIINPLDDN